MRIVNLLTSFLAAGVAAGCGAPADTNKDGITDGTRAPDNVTAIAPATPTGSISGQVVDSKFQGISGAEVKLVLGKPSDKDSAYSATTDANGNFAFLHVPAGSSGAVTVKKEGFSSVRVPADVPAIAGSAPLNDGNASVGTLVLLALDGSVKFNVLTKSGTPATNAKAQLEVTPAGFQTFGPIASTFSYGTAIGVLTAEATVGADGTLSFSGVPSPGELARVGGKYRLTIAMLDDDGDGIEDFLGTRREYDGLTFYTDPPSFIVLEDARSSLALGIEGTNVGSLLGTEGASGQPYRNFVAADEDLYVVFNQRVAQGSVSVALVGEDCTTTVEVVNTFPAANILVINPSSSLQAGREYNLSIRATSLESGTPLSAQGYVFVSATGEPPTLAAPSWWLKKAEGNTQSSFQAGDTVYVHFDQLVGGTGTKPTICFESTELGGGASVTVQGECKTDVPGLDLEPAEGSYFDPRRSTFACTASKYTTRFELTADKMIGFTTLNNLTTSKTATIRFPRSSSAAAGMTTIWGKPLAAEFTGVAHSVPRP